MGKYSKAEFKGAQHVWLKRLTMGCGASNQLKPPPSPVGARMPAPTFHTFESKLSNGQTRSIEYLIWFPPSHNASTEPIPLLVYLHGAGGRDLREYGAEIPFSMDRLWSLYPNPLSISERAQEFPFAVMMPHCPTGSEWAKALLPVHVNNTVLTIAADTAHNIDISRIHVTGKSMGGEGSWKVAAMCPRLWASVVPLCGGMWPYKDGADGCGAKDYGKLVTMPAWVFHAEPDGHVPIRESEIAIEAVSAVNKCVKFTRYPDAPDQNGHDCWTRGYSDPDLYVWLQAQHNTELSQNGLGWARQEMEDVMIHRCAVIIQTAARVDPFAFKKSLKKTMVSKSKWGQAKVT